MPATEDEVERFLQDFKAKIEVFDVIFKDREKNNQTLYDLEIKPHDRIHYLKALKVQDYYQGPFDDYNIPGGQLWEFGITIKGKTVYIKINLNIQSMPVICISFHIAERKMNFPFQKGGKK